MHTLLGLSLLFAPGPANQADLPNGAIAKFGSPQFRHASQAGQAALSPDGKLLVSLGTDGLRGWDVATGKQRLFHPTGEKGAFIGTVFSPDGKLLAGSCDKSLALWDVAQRKIRLTFGNADHGCHSLLFSADGKRLATRCRDGKVRIWDTVSGKLTAELQAAWLAYTFSGDGKTIIADKQWGLVCFWDVASQKITREIKLADHYYLVTSLVLSPDNELLAIGTGPHHENDGVSPDMYFRMHDVATGKERYRIGTKPHFVSAVAFAPDGKTMVLAKHGSKSVLEMRQVADGKLLRTVPLAGGNYYCLSFSGDGKMLAAASVERLAVQLWSHPDFTPHLPSVGHDMPITAVAYAANGAFACSTSEDATLITWDLKTRKPLHTWPIPPGRINEPGLAASVLATPDGKLIAAAVWTMGDSENRKGAIDVRSFPDGKTLHQFYAAGSIALSPDGKILAAGAGDGMRLWDLPSGDARPRIQGPAKAVRRLAYSPDGELLASTSKHGAVQLWRMPGGDFAGQFALTSEDAGDFYSAAPITPAFSPDGRYLACVHSRRSTTIEAWEMASGERVRVITLNRKQTRIPVVLFNGRTLLLGDHWTAPQLFDLTTGKELPRPMDLGPVNAMARSPDGRSVMTGGPDGIPVTWNAEILNGPAADKPDWSAKDLARFWGDLDARAEAAFAARWELVRGGDATVKFLADHLRPAAGPDRQLLARRLAELNSAEFKVRDRANHDLEQWGRLIEFDVRKALEGNLPLEGRRRLQLLHAKIEKLGAPIRTLRAIGVLEAIGTGPARDLLQKMAQGAPGARTTADAKASLQRWHR